MASVNSFSNPQAVFPDNIKSSEGFVATPVAGSAFSFSATPAVPASAFTIVNDSLNELRGLITWTAGITSGTSPSTFTVSPNGGVSMDFASTNLAMGSVDAVESVTLEAITVTGNGEVGANSTPATTTVVGGRVRINFASN